MNPECQQGKHGNCDGRMIEWVLVDDLRLGSDTRPPAQPEITTCDCSCHKIDESVMAWVTAYLVQVQDTETSRVMSIRQEPEPVDGPIQDHSWLTVGGLIEQLSRIDPDALVASSDSSGYEPMLLSVDPPCTTTRMLYDGDGWLQWIHGDEASALAIYPSHSVIDVVVL